MHLGSQSRTRHLELQNRPGIGANLGSDLSSNNRRLNICDHKIYLTFEIIEQIWGSKIVPEVENGLDNTLKTIPDPGSLFNVQFDFVGIKSVDKNSQRSFDKLQVDATLNTQT